MKNIRIEERQEYTCYTVEQIFSSTNKMVRGFVEKNYSKALHSQAFYEINIVLSGSATHYFGERTLTVSEGDVFIVPPNMLHGYAGGEGFDVYHLLLSPAYLEKYAASLQLLPAFSRLFKIDPLMRAKTSARLHFRLDAKETARLMPRLETLIERSHRETYVDALISEGEALIVISELCDICERRAVDSPYEENEDAAFLSSVAYLYAHYDETLTIETLSKIAQMSRNAYIEKFKRTMGNPPARFIKLHRVEMIKQMLKDTSLSESEIADAVGCVDVSHLIRLFSSEMGIVPSKYRKNMQ